VRRRRAFERVGGDDDSAHQPSVPHEP
jgi:hypothetical protein